ncbi:MAG: 50S ribosomal protein L1 [Fimbriimonadales bacterium]|nr:50S ribosomal protein L1 [Fimbriimonadales bacterium]
MIKQERKKLKKKLHSDRYDALRKLADPQALHTPEEAIALVKKSANAKFVETVDLSLRLGIDPKKSDQNVRGTLNLPHGTGKTRKVAVLAKGAHAEAAQAAGADEVGAEDLVEKIVSGYKDFDVLIAHQEMAPHLAKIGRVLGPRTPSKASGTLTEDVAKAVKDIKSAVRVEYRNDKAGIVHMPIGKTNMTEEQLLANFRAAIEGIIKAKPQTAKGRYLLSITLSSTMGPGFRVDPQFVTKSA